jgi:glycosyltransferase involved in cell wall biosynthesis
MKRKLLGIYIPTYNRAGMLSECLRGFIRQCKPYGYPIFISDNASTDDTERVARSCQKEYPLISYSRSRKNLGYARNFANVLKMGDTDYVYLAGDDDKPLPGAISEITGKLMTGRYDYLQINARCYSLNLRNVIKERMIRKYEDEEYGRREYSRALLNNGGSGYQFFMSSIILRKSLLDKEIGRLDASGPNMDFIHTICFYRGIVNRRGMLIAEPLIMNRGGNWGYSSHIMDIFFVSSDLTYSLIAAGYTAKTMREARSSSLFNLAIPVAIDRIINRSDPEEAYDRYIRANPHIAQGRKRLLWLELHTPRAILRLLYDGYVIVKRY